MIRSFTYNAGILKCTFRWRRISAQILTFASRVASRQPLLGSLTDRSVATTDIRASGLLNPRAPSKAAGHVCQS